MATHDLAIRESISRLHRQHENDYNLVVSAMDRKRKITLENAILKMQSKLVRLGSGDIGVGKNSPRKGSGSRSPVHVRTGSQGHRSVASPVGENASRSSSLIGVHADANEENGKEGGRPRLNLLSPTLLGSPTHVASTSNNETAGHSMTSPLGTLVLGASSNVNLSRSESLITSPLASWSGTPGLGFPRHRSTDDLNQQPGSPFSPSSSASCSGIYSSNHPTSFHQQMIDAVHQQEGSFHSPSTSPTIEAMKLQNSNPPPPATYLLRASPPTMGTPTFVQEPGGMNPMDTPPQGRSTSVPSVAQVGTTAVPLTADPDGSAAYLLSGRRSNYGDELDAFEEEEEERMKSSNTARSVATVSPSTVGNASLDPAFVKQAAVGYNPPLSKLSPTAATSMNATYPPPGTKPRQGTPVLLRQTEGAKPLGARAMLEKRHEQQRQDRRQEQERGSSSSGRTEATETEANIVVARPRPTSKAEALARLKETYAGFQYSIPIVQSSGDLCFHSSPDQSRSSSQHTTSNATATFSLGSSHTGPIGNQHLTAIGPSTGSLGSSLNPMPNAASGESGSSGPASSKSEGIVPAFSFPGTPSGSRENLLTLVNASTTSRSSSASAARTSLLSKPSSPPSDPVIPTPSPQATTTVLKVPMLQSPTSLIVPNASPAAADSPPIYPMPTMNPDGSTSLPPPSLVNKSNSASTLGSFPGSAQSTSLRTVLGSVVSDGEGLQHIAGPHTPLDLGGIAGHGSSGGSSHTLRDSQHTDSRGNTYTYRMPQSLTHSDLNGSGTGSGTAHGSSWSGPMQPSSNNAPDSERTSSPTPERGRPRPTQMNSSPSQLTGNQGLKISGAISVMSGSTSGGGSDFGSPGLGGFVEENSGSTSLEILRLSGQAHSAAAPGYIFDSSGSPSCAGTEESPPHTPTKPPQNRRCTLVQTESGTMFDPDRSPSSVTPPVVWADPEVNPPTPILVATEEHQSIMMPPALIPNPQERFIQPQLQLAPVEVEVGEPAPSPASPTRRLSVGPGARRPPPLDEGQMNQSRNEIAKRMNRTSSGIHQPVAPGAMAQNTLLKLQPTPPMMSSGTPLTIPLAPSSQRTQQPLTEPPVEARESVPELPKILPHSFTPKREDSESFVSSASTNSSVLPPRYASAFFVSPSADSIGTAGTGTTECSPLTPTTSQSYRPPPPITSTNTEPALGSANSATHSVLDTPASSEAGSGSKSPPTGVSGRDPVSNSSRSGTGPITTANAAPGESYTITVSALSDNSSTEHPRATMESRESNTGEQNMTYDPSSPIIITSPTDRSVEQHRAEIEDAATRLGEASEAHSDVSSPTRLPRGKQQHLSLHSGLHPEPLLKPPQKVFGASMSFITVSTDSGPASGSASLNPPPLVPPIQGPPPVDLAAEGTPSDSVASPTRGESSSRRSASVSQELSQELNVSSQLGSLGVSQRTLPDWDSVAPSSFTTDPRSTRRPSTTGFGTPPLNVSQRGSVSQRTLPDWDSVSLATDTRSTATTRRPSAGFATPPLNLSQQQIGDLGVGVAPPSLVSFVPNRRNSRSEGASGPSHNSSLLNAAANSTTSTARLGASGSTAPYAPTDSPPQPSPSNSNGPLQRSFGDPSDSPSSHGSSAALQMSNSSMVLLQEGSLDSVSILAGLAPPPAMTRAAILQAALTPLGVGRGQMQQLPPSSSTTSGGSANQFSPSVTLSPLTVLGPTDPTISSGPGGRIQGNMPQFPCALELPHTPSQGSSTPAGSGEELGRAPVSVFTAPPPLAPLIVQTERARGGNGPSYHENPDASSFVLSEMSESGQRTGSGSSTMNPPAAADSTPSEASRDAAAGVNPSPTVLNPVENAQHQQAYHLHQLQLHQRPAVTLEPGGGAEQQASAGMARLAALKARKEQEKLAQQGQPLQHQQQPSSNSSNKSEFRVVG